MANCLQYPDLCSETNKPIVSDTAKFVGSFFLTTFLCIAILSSYCILHRSRKIKPWLQPRMYQKVRKRNGKITKIRVNGLSIRDIASLTDSQLMQYIGLDGVVFLLFIKSCIKICCFCTLLAVTLLIPIYVTATSDEHEEDVDFIEMMTIDHVGDGSWRLWFCVFAAFAFTLFSLLILYRDAGYIAKMVDRFLSQTHISHYTVMVTDIPPQYQNQQKFSHLLETIYPDRIEKVHVIKDTNAVQRVAVKLRMNRHKLLDAIEHRNRENQRMTMVAEWRDYFRCSHFPWPRRTDCIHHYNLRVRDLQIELKNAKLRPRFGATAFVQFKDLVTTSFCVSTQLFANTLHFKCTLAPYPEDLQTQHLLGTDQDHFRSQTLINLIVLGIISIWIFLINSSVMLSNIESVVHYFYGIYAKQHLHFVPESFWILITSILPTLLIKMWLVLLPVALRATYNKLGVYKDTAQQNLQLMNKYSFLLVCMVLLSVVIVQIVGGALDHIVHSLTNIFSTMAKSLSKTSTLFIQYMMITALIFDPICLFYPLQIRFLYAPLYRFCGWKEEDLRKLDFVYFYSNLSLELIITVTYSVCSPMILFFSLMHFLMSSLIFRHLLITFYDATCSIGRFIWIDLVENVLYGLLLPIATLIGLVIMKRAYIAAILLIVLLTFILQIQQTMYLNTKMSSAFKCVCLQTAAKMDTENQFRDLIRSEYPSSHTQSHRDDDDEDLNVSHVAGRLSSRGRYHPRDDRGAGDDDMGSDHRRLSLFERVYVPDYSDCSSQMSM